MDFEAFLARCRHDRNYADQIQVAAQLPARPASFREPASPLPDPLASVLGGEGISQLYTHQCDALEAARRGEHVVVATGTASGKTLCYNLPALEHWLADREARALYLFPTKALAQDQLRGLLRFRDQHPFLGFDCGTYDGDTPAEMRTRLRDTGHFILTNPDMLHSGVLPNHTRWAEFFAKLRYVVVDEIHTYRGIFGSNVANVLLRLRRIAEHYGARPQFIGCSATIANPDEHAANLIGEPVTLVDQDGSPRGPRRFVLWNPPLLDDQLSRRRSPNVEAQALMCELLRNRVQTICFTRARVVAELLYRYVKDALTQLDPRLANSVRAYRGGYLAEERREIERQLFSGELLGVTTTSALELGIDIGGLDACLIVGYPGSIASCWQQAGRAGRGSAEALVMLIGSDAPIDQYLMSHPDYFFGQNPEHAIIDRENYHILLGHLRCAASELPVTYAEVGQFGEWAPAILDLLEEDSQVRRHEQAWFWTGSRYPANDLSLRTVSDETYNIVDRESQQVIGTVDGISAFSLVHDQAIYLHHGETWFVEQLDLQQRNAYVKRIAADYYTNVVTETKIRLEAAEVEGAWRDSKVGFGDVTVTIFTLMFRKIKFYGHDSLGFGNLDLPPQPLETSAMWLIPPAAALHRLREFGRLPAEGMLGIANVLVDIVPLYVLCDYADIGCVVDSGNFGSPSIFIYDRYPGGLGFAHKAHELLEEILNACVYLVHHCPCESGCPSCVGSTARNFVHYDAEGEARARIPDKEAALVILHHLLGLEPYLPRALSAAELARRGGDSTSPAPPIKRLPESIEAKLRKRIQGLKQR
ncbi:MAG: DEAD/DEAH box helicase [Fimbriimonadaceae bacterium]|nr:DEAD/DEAH box helicase [Fimbriimonadaceae bacterium]